MTNWRMCSGISSCWLSYSCRSAWPSAITSARQSIACSFLFGSFMPELTAQIQARSVDRKSAMVLIRHSGGAMAASLIKDLYYSPNGDRWSLCRDVAGKLVVSHQPSDASGGHASETAVELFLSFGGHG